MAIAGRRTAWLPSDELRVAEEAGAAVGEVGRGQHDGDRAGEHQRDEREVQAAEAQRRQPDQRAEHHRDHARQQQHDRERQRRREQQPRRDPGAERQHRDLARARPGRRGPSAARGRARRPSRSPPPSSRRPSRLLSSDGSDEQHEGQQPRAMHAGLDRVRGPVDAPIGSRVSAARDDATSVARQPQQRDVASTNGVMSRYCGDREDRRDQRVDEPDDDARRRA